MIQSCGLIELEACEREFADSDDCCDSTLRGLFARLVGEFSREDATHEQNSSHATLLLANLDGLSEDLHAITREVLSEIFLARGCR